mgnify:CR=1 FL=1
MGHPADAEAAVIGVAHPKWTERPLLVIDQAEGQTVEKCDVLGILKAKVADRRIPNDSEFFYELQQKATGKVKKIELRRQFADYAFPE